MLNGGILRTTALIAICWIENMDGNASECEAGCHRFVFVSDVTGLLFWLCHFANVMSDRNVMVAILCWGRIFF